MENVHGLLTALMFCVALLVLLRWIVGGARPHAGSRAPRARVPESAEAWRHVETRRRDLASTGNWQVRIR